MCPCRQINSKVFRSSVSLAALTNDKFNRHSEHVVSEGSGQIFLREKSFLNSVRSSATIARKSIRQTIVMSVIELAKVTCQPRTALPNFIFRSLYLSLSHTHTRARACARTHTHRYIYIPHLSLFARLHGEKQRPRRDKKELTGLALVWCSFSSRHMQRPSPRKLRELRPKQIHQGISSLTLCRPLLLAHHGCAGVQTMHVMSP